MMKSYLVNVSMILLINLGIFVSRSSADLFWTTDGGYFRKASLDGSGQNLVMTQPNTTMALDSVNDMFYWGSSGAIMRSFSDGTGVEQLTATSPFDVHDIAIQEVQVVPVPSSVILGGLGLAYANWRLRRKH